MLDQRSELLAGRSRVVRPNLPIAGVPAGPLPVLLMLGKRITAGVRSWSLPLFLVSGRPVGGRGSIPGWRLSRAAGSVALCPCAGLLPDLVSYGKCYATWWLWVPPLPRRGKVT